MFWLSGWKKYVESITDNINIDKILSEWGLDSETIVSIFVRDLTGSTEMVGN